MLANMGEQVTGADDAIAASWRRTQSREPVAISSAYLADAVLARGDRVKVGTAASI